MIKLYCRTVDHDKILKSLVVEIEQMEENIFFDIVSNICEQMDLSTPIILDKHYNQMKQFNHTEFLANEFMESVDFKKFIIEIMNEEAEKTGKLPFYSEYAWLNFINFVLH